MVPAKASGHPRREDAVPVRRRTPRLQKLLAEGSHASGKEMDPPQQKEKTRVDEEFERPYPKRTAKVPWEVWRNPEEKAGGDEWPFFLCSSSPFRRRRGESPNFSLSSSSFLLFLTWAIRERQHSEPFLMAKHNTHVDAAHAGAERERD